MLEPPPDAWLYRHDHEPEPLRSYFPTSCSETIELYSGRGALTLQRQHFEARHVAVNLEWLTRPRLAVRASFVSHADLPWPSDDDSATLDLHLGTTRRNGFPLTVQAELVSRASDDTGTDAELFIREPVVVADPADHAATWVSVHLVNCLDFAGEGRTTERVGKGRRWGHQRFTIKNDTWILLVDPVDRVKERLQEATRQGGFTISHAARLEAAGRLLLAKNVPAILEEIEGFLSLITGSTVGACLATGYDEDDRELWQVWRAPRARPYEGHLGPLPRSASESPVLRGPDLSSTSQKWLELSRNRETSSLLSRLGDWYRGALHAPSMTAAMFTGAGLELVTYWHLVTRQGLSAGAFDKLPSADALRLFISSLGVPLDIPDALEGLHELAASKPKERWDGPQCVTAFRNGVVHPPVRGNRDYLNDKKLQGEAALLGHWYLDLAVLRLLDYDGGYRSRIATKPGAVLVPWASNREGRKIHSSH